MRMQFLAKAALAGLILACPLTASAQDWYAGIGLGQSENKQRLSKLGGPGFISTAVDNEDSAWKVFGGYRLWDEFVAVEVSYADLGKTKVEGTSAGSASSGTQEIDTFTIGLVGRIPITDPLGVIIHLGFSRNDSKMYTTIAGASTFEGATDFEFYYGGGLQYEITETIGIRAELEVFEIADYRVNLLSAGLLYRF
ncbi:MAG: outer membrane beta-barrel protein [Sulfuricaulis sp.]